MGGCEWRVSGGNVGCCEIVGGSGGGVGGHLGDCAVWFCGGCQLRVPILLQSRCSVRKVLNLSL